jgi:hypothetical protein
MQCPGLWDTPMSAGDQTVKEDGETVIPTFEVFTKDELIV